MPRYQGTMTSKLKAHAPARDCKTSETAQNKKKPMKVLIYSHSHVEVEASVRRHKVSYTNISSITKCHVGRQYMWPGLVNLGF